MPQSTASYFSKCSSTTMFPMAVLPWEPFWKAFAEKCINSFFSKFKPKVLQNHWLRFVKQWLSRCFLLVKCYSTVHNCVWFLGLETWYAEYVKTCKNVWIVLTYRLDSIHFNVPNIIYQSLNQKFLSAEHLLVINFHEKLLSSQIWWTDKAKKWNELFFSSKTNLVSLNNQWKPFLQQGMNRIFRIISCKYFLS